MSKIPMSEQICCCCNVLHWASQKLSPGRFSLYQFFSFLVVPFSTWVSYSNNVFLFHMGSAMNIYLKMFFLFPPSECTCYVFLCCSPPPGKNHGNVFLCCFAPAAAGKYIPFIFWHLCSGKANRVGLNRTSLLVSKKHKLRNVVKLVETSAKKQNPRRKKQYFVKCWKGRLGRWPSLVWVEECNLRQNTVNFWILTPKHPLFRMWRHKRSKFLLL